MKSLRLLLCLVFVTWVDAGPINIRMEPFSTCSRRCTETNKFRYTPGMTYEHEYHVTTETLMEGANSRKATIQISAIADIEVESKCDFILRLRDVKLYDTSKTHLTFVDNAGRFKRILERSPLRFSFQDGVIEDLCPAEDEDPWALNIKRGILTSLQNSMDDLERDQTVKETDVTGSCVTDYKLKSRGWYTNTITKTKDLMSCTDRHGYQSAIHAIPYRVPSDIQSLPLMKSTHVCEHEIGRTGIMNSVTCRESHIYRPFSNHNSGAVTHVVQKLVYKRQKSTIEPRRGIPWNRASINFRHVYGFGNTDHQMNIEFMLKELCSIAHEDIRPDVPRLFSELVYIVREMDSAAIANVFSRVQAGVICSSNVQRGRKFILDAIPMAGTKDSVEVMKTMLINNVVTGVEVDIWLTSLTFIQNPTMEMLVAVKPLIETPELMMKAMLPVSSLVNNYCEVNPGCAQETAVVNILSVLEKHIGSRCYARNSKMDVMLMALRAVGNAGHVPSVTSVLYNCITQPSNPVEVRIAAIEAFRRMPCTQDRNVVINLFRDVQEDAEIRVAAYLAAMQCPTEHILNIIMETLENERAGHVGSFIWSHLINLMETSSPLKQPVRAILENEHLKKEFDMERMKYSRNYEASLFFEKFNTGAMVESNLIWSPKSFIPRSAMVNLTVDLFGHSINLFDIGGRVEGLEYLLETYLGPYGYFGDKNRAAASADLDKIRGSMYMRMFGNELMFKNFRGTDAFGRRNDFSFMNILKKLSSNYDYSTTQNIMFLDSTMIIPTSTGLPLMLAVNGSATVDITANGKVDLRKLYNSPRSLHIDGAIQPSGAVHISGTMVVDAGVTKTGMRIVNTWHSSTAVRGRIELDRGKILSAEIDVPRDKMEILDVTTAFFTIHGNVEEEEVLMEDSRKTFKMCSGSKTAKITGIETCLEFQFINASMVDTAPYFPLTGPFAFGVNIYKRDTHRSYKLIAKQTETKSLKVAQMAFNTPGSSVDRALAFDMTMNYKKKQMEVSLVTPWKKVGLTGSVVNDREMKRFTSVLQIDERWRYGIDTSMAIERTKEEITLIPHIEISRPSAENIIVDGTIVTDRRRHADLSMTVTGITRNPFALKSSVQNTYTETSAMIQITTPDQKRYLANIGLIHEKSIRRSTLRIAPKIIIKTPISTPISIIGDFEYKGGKSIKTTMTMFLPTVLDKPISFKCDFRRSSMSSNRYQGDISINSKYLVAKMNGLFYRKKSGGGSSRLTLDYSLPKYLNIPPNRLTLSSKLQDKSTKSLTKYFLNANMDSKTTPYLNFQADMDLSHSRSKFTGIGATIKYGNSHKISGSASLTHRIKGNQASFEYDMKGKSTAHGIDFSVKADHKQDKKYLTSAIDMKYGKKHMVKAALNLKDDSTKKLAKMFGDLSLAYPGNTVFISSDLTQPSHREYNHNINFKFDKSKYIISTSYKRPSKTSHSIKSDIVLPFVKPIRFIGMTDLDPNDLKLSGHIDHDNDAYALTTKYKYADGSKGKWSMDISYPSRHIEMEIEGERNGSLFTGKIDTKWDADRDKKQRLMLFGKMDIPSISRIDSSFILKYPSRTLQLILKNNADTNYVTHAEFSWLPHKQIVIDATIIPPSVMGEGMTRATISMHTPFRGIRDISVDVTAENTVRHISTKANIFWDRKVKEITAAVTISKPISLRYLDFSFSGTTPWKNFQKMNVGVMHRMNTNLKTEIKASLDRKNVQLIITGQNVGNFGITNIEGSANLKTNIRGVEAVLFKIISHAEQNKLESDIILEMNGEQYIWKMDMYHQRKGINIQNSGKLHVLAGPYFTMTNNWNHFNTGRSARTVFNSDWGNGQILQFDLEGNHLSSATTKTSGSMNIRTPWEIVRNVDMSLSNELGSGLVHNRMHYIHNGVTVIKTNINYISLPDGIECDITVSTPWMEDIIGKVTTQTSRHPMTAHAEFQWSPGRKTIADGRLNAMSLTNMNGELRVITPYTIIPNIVIRGSQKQEGFVMITSGSVEYGTRNTIEFETRIQLEHTIKVWAKLRTPFQDFREIEADVEFIGTLHDFTSRSEITISPIFGTMKGILQWNYLSNIQAKLRIETPFVSFPYFQTSMVSEATTNGWHTLFETEYSPRRVITVDTTLRLTQPFSLDILIKTPFANAEHMRVFLEQTWRNQLIQTHIEATYAGYERIEGDMKITWTANSADIVVDVHPFIDHAVLHIDYRNEMNAFSGNVRATVGQIFEVTCTTTLRKVSTMITAEIKGDYIIEHMRGNIIFSVTGKMLEPEMQIDITGGYNNEMIKISAKMTMTEESLIMSMPFYSLENIDLLHFIKTMSVSIKTSFLSDIVLNIENVTHRAKFVRKVWGSIGQEIKGLAMLTGTAQGDTTSVNFEAQFQHYDTATKIAFDLKMNVDDMHKQMIAVMTVDQQTVEINVVVKYNEAITGMTSLYGIVKHIQTVEVIIKNPYTENIVLNVEQTISPSQFIAKLSGSIGSANNIEMTVNAHVRSTSLIIECEAMYRMENIHKRAVFNIHANNNGAEKDVTITVNFDNNVFEIATLMRTTGGFHGQVTIKTPIDMLKHVELTVDFRTGEHTIDVEFTLTSMNDTIISGKLNHIYNSWRVLRSAVEMTTPFTGYESTKASYSHHIQDGTVTGSAHITYATGRTVSSNVKVSTVPAVRFEVNVHTPFSGYEDISVTGEFVSERRKYEVTTVMDIGGAYKIAFSSTVDLSVTPMTAVVQITTPIENFENTELRLTHRGTWKDFKSTIHFKSPYTNSLRAQASLQFTSLFDFDGTILFNSKLPSLRHLKLLTTTSHRNGNYKIHNEIMWASKREIVIDASFGTLNNWGRKEILVAFEATTPFGIAKQLSMKLETATEPGKFTQKIEAERNGQTFLDSEIEYTMNTRHMGSIIFRYPYPMHFTVSGHNTGSNFDGDMMLNWNKDEPNSNVRFQTEYRRDTGGLNNIFNVKMIHPLRTMGISGSVKNNARHSSSTGEITWNEDAGHKLFYDVSLNDRSRPYNTMYDSSLKFGFPGRSLQMTGSYENNQRTKALGGSFFWDADNDHTREIGVKAILIPSESKADVTFRLPSVGKDVTIGTKMVINEGRTIFSGQTEFSYSLDTRKTLTLTSKVEDISAGYGSSNYSIFMGVMHPYTDLDCRLSGNIGQSREIYSAMVDVKYLTTRRENMNLALRAEINRLRNQINLAVVSPIITLETDGQVMSTNPLKMEVVNRFNNWKVIKSAITVDPTRKHFDIQTNYDVENPDRKIEIIGRYLDSKTIQAEIAHLVNYREHNDALISLTLNTSRLLHTRIMWQPQLLTHIQDFMKTKIQNIEQEIVSATKGITSAVGDEIEARYQVTLDHIENEAGPLLRIIERETTVLLHQLKYINAEIKAMYNRNDYYMHTIGKTVWVPVNVYDDLIMRYMDALYNVKGGLRNILETLKSYPIKEKYMSWVQNYVLAIEQMVNEGVSMAIEMIDRIDEAAVEARHGYNRHMDWITHQATHYMDSWMGHPWHTYNSYMNSMADSITNGIRVSGLPGHYNTVMTGTRNFINRQMAHVITDADIRHIHNMASEAYQQGVWAYNYWNVEDNIEKYAREIVTIIKEIIMEEVAREFSLTEVLRESRLVVFDPVHGEIQFEIYLPFPVKSLDVLPDIVPYINRTKHKFHRYVPDVSAIRQFYGSYAPSVRGSNYSQPYKNYWFSGAVPM